MKRLHVPLAIALAASLPSTSRATPVLARTYSATSTIGNVKNLILMSDGSLLAIGVDTGKFVKFSADGSSVTDITYYTGTTATPLAAFSIISAVLSGSDLYFSINGTHASYRYTLSGTTATFVASAAPPMGAPTGATTVALCPSGNFVVTRASGSNSIVEYAPDLSVVSMGSIGAAAQRSWCDSSGVFWYTTSSGQIRKSPSFVSTSEVTLVTGLGTSTASPNGLVVSPNGYIYVSNYSWVKKISPAAASLWTKVIQAVPASPPVGYPAGTAAPQTMTLDQSTGKIYVISYAGAITEYYPIDAPTSVSASSSAPTTVDLSWTTGVADSDFSGVTIRRSTSAYPISPTDGELVTVDNTDTSWIDSDLMPGTTYYYSFFNETADGYFSTLDADSRTTVTTTVDTTPTAAPSSFEAEATGYDIALSWVNPVDSDFASVTLRRSPSDYPDTVTEGDLVVENSTGTTHSDEDLAEGTYYYSLFALDTYDNVSVAANATVTIDLTPPAAPTSFVSDANTDSVDLAWTNPSTDFSHTVLRYSTTGYPTAITDGDDLALDSSDTSYSHTDLTEGTYYYSLFAVDAHDNVSIAAQVSATIDNTPPSAPSSFSAIATDNDVALSWTNPSLDFSHVVLRYSRTTYPTSSTDGLAITLSTSDPSYAHNNVSDGTYYYSLFAVDAAGNLSIAAQATATVDTTPTNAPSSFVAEVSGSGSIALSWSNPVDSDFASVTIRRSTTSTPASIASGDAVLSASTDTSHTDSSLSSGTTYYYAIFALDETGNVSTSASATATLCNTACATCDGPGADDCTSCASSEYLAAGVCSECSTCDANEHVATACTSTTDTVCAPNVDASVEPDASSEPDASVESDADLIEHDANTMLDDASTHDGTVVVDASPALDAQLDASIDAETHLDATSIDSAIALDAASLDSEVTFDADFFEDAETDAQDDAEILADADVREDARVADAHVTNTPDGSMPPGGGGGSCSAAQGRQSSGAWALVALFAALLLPRRRSRQQRR